MLAKRRSASSKPQVPIPSESRTVSPLPQKTIKEQHPPGMLKLLMGALAGSAVDYTKGSLNQAIWLLAVPMVLEMALESIFAVVDIFWVSHLGSNAVGAIGLTESLLMLVYAISGGLGTAATALVARRMGEGDGDRAAIDAVQAMGVGLLIGLLLLYPAYRFAPAMLSLLGAPAPLLQVGASYARVTLASSGVIIMLSLNNAIFRGAGDPAFAMRLLAAANVINLVLDPLLIFGIGPFPKLGVTGPAVATLIGRSCAVLYQEYRLLKGTERFKIRRRHLKLNLGEMARFLRVSSTGILQFLLEQGSWLGLVRIVSLFGAAAIAGYTIAFRIVGFVLLPSFGLSNAAATLVGQHMGAGDHARARSSVWRTGLWNFALLGSASLVFIVFAPWLVGLFSHEAAVKPLAVESLRVLSAGNLFFAFEAVFVQAFNGAGDTRTPTIINFVGFWLVEIPMAWFLSRHTSLHISGIFYALLTAQTIAVAASGFLFLRGDWTKTKALTSA